MKVSCAVEGVVVSPLLLPHQHRLDITSPVATLSGAQALGQFELVVVEVHADDSSGTDLLGGLVTGERDY